MPHSSVRHAIRRLWRDRSITLIALGILALGIGANTALFTVVDAALLRPLPYPAPDRLVLLRIFDPEFQDRYSSFPVNAAHIATWRDHCRGCEDLAALHAMTTTLTGTGEAEQLDGATVTANFFAFLGISPALGAGFTTPGSAAHDDEAVISHALWLRTFGGDAGVIGRMITLDGKPARIVGVLPAQAPIPAARQLGDLVRLPLRIDIFRPHTFAGDELRSTGDLDYGVIARLRPAVTAAALRAELDALEPVVSKQTEDDGRKRVLVTPLADIVSSQARGPLVVLLAATIAVLLIVCVNLANLLLARHAARRRDAAIRAAIGAGRSDLLADALIESLLLAAGGGALGLGVAWALTRIIVGTAPAALPVLNAVSMDARVFLFSAVTTLAAGLLVGVLPALRNARVAPADSLKAGSYTSTDSPRGAHARRALVAAQAAMGAALLVATGLLLASFVRLVHVDKGFDTAGILTVDVALPASYATDARRLQVLDDVLTRLRAMPGVTSVAYTTRLPLRGEGTVNLLSYVDDQRPPAARPLANYRYVTPEYFSTIGTPLLRGRTFAPADRGRGVVILSASAAEALWPGQDAIGRILRTGGYLGGPSEVIGVAADSRAVDLARKDVLFAYLPHWLRAPATASIVARTSVTPESLAAPARRAIWDVDRNVAIPHVLPMDDLVAASVADRRFEMSLMIAFGCAAAVLAALGVYGVVSYSVARRGREMGIRMALGARPGDIHRLVIVEGLAPVTAGLVAGLIASLMIGRAMRSLLFEVRPGDPLVMLGAAAIVTVAALIACAAPARRAVISGATAGMLR
jgi:putative ABC transport system permease protein